MAVGLGAIFDQGFVKYSLGFGTTNLPATPTGIWLSLHTAAIGTNKVLVNEWPTTNTNYARGVVGVGTTNWTAAAFVAGTGVVATNVNQIQLLASGPGAVGSAFPLNILACGLEDVVTIGSGNLLWFADLGSAVAVALGITVQFNAGTDISLTLL